jgi:hypothetical protein
MRTLAIALFRAVPLLLMLASPAAFALRYDHYDPVLLNEHAIRFHQQGDSGTARVLLHRALRLAPDNATVAYNLKLLEDNTASGTMRSAIPEADAGKLPVAATSEKTELPPEPPAPWLKK